MLFPEIGNQFFVLMPDLLPGVQDDLLQGMRDAANDAMVQDAIKKKTEQAMGLVGLVAVPVGLLIAAFVLKVVYDAFTKTADSMTGVMGKAAEKLQNVYYDIKYKDAPFSDDDEDEEEPEPEERPADDGLSVTGPTVMLFGEIVRRYVVDSLSEDDIKRALARQKADGNGSRLGEIMEELKLITRIEVSKTLKIQERQREKASG